MTVEQFLETIYNSIAIGMVIERPKKNSVILNITDTGSICYLVGESNRKYVTKDQLVLVYGALVKGPLSSTRLLEIAGSSSTCDVTVIRWLLEHSGLAEEKNKTMRKLW